MASGGVMHAATNLRAVSSARRLPNLIGGKFRESKASRFTSATDPTCGAVTTFVPSNSTAEEIDQVVNAAADAFPAWSRTPVSKRINIMFRLRELVVKNTDHLASLVRLELGKIPADARGDVIRGLEVLEFSCGAASQLAGSTISNFATNLDVAQRKEPLGVCLGVCPFNFPAMIPLWMFPLAIACGNTFILKPSELVPSASHCLAELAIEAGVPAGVLNLIHGGKETVDQLLERDEIKAVSFVGSTPVGTAIYRKATSRGIRAQCNLGAKNHAVILPDCDMDQALNQLVGAAFGASGQRCMALSAAVFVGNAKSFIPELVKKALALKVGASDDADLGPVVTPAAKKRIESLVATGRKEGAEILLDGTGKTDVVAGGNWVHPTVIGSVTRNMTVYKEEIFGPVLVCLEAADLDGALDIVNSNVNGNGAAIFTESGSAAKHFETNVKAGQVGINLPIPLGPPQMSFTGSRGSILGDLQFYGTSGVQFFTKPKNVVSRWMGASDALYLSSPSTVIPTSR